MSISLVHKYVAAVVKTIIDKNIKKFNYFDLLTFLMKMNCF